MNIPYKGKTPNLHPSVFVAEGARLIGDVTVGEDASVWFNAVLRGDLAPIRIGRGTNIQDNAVGHVDEGRPLIVGDRVTVGHGAVIHGCTIHDGALIGMGAIVLSGAEVGECALVGAGSVVKENSVIPPRTLAVGVPAKPVRELTEDEIRQMAENAESYVRKGKEFRGEIQ
mgnify:FL=1